MSHTKVTVLATQTTDKGIQFDNTHTTCSTYSKRKACRMYSSSLHERLDQVPGERGGARGCTPLQTTNRNRLFADIRGRLHWQFVLVCAAHKCAGRLLRKSKFNTQLYNISIRHTRPLCLLDGRLHQNILRRCHELPLTTKHCTLDCVSQRPDKLADASS